MKKDVLIIGLSSLPGGGKDYIADILTKKYGFYKISPGDIIREKLSRMKKGKISREEQQKLQDILRKRYGKDYVMELCLKRIKSIKKDRIAIAGIRFPNDIRFFKRQKDIRFYNIFVYAPVKIRFKRTMDRKRIDAPASYKEFLKGDRNERKIFNLKETEKLSDFKLENSENESVELEKKIKNIIEKTM
ncbi:MAG: AAA family ATPase [Candidatus Parvarchaeota archaeon]|nr:AAA family ATPase [Candidatus Parvarchaeota archaeon]MCL5106620.1 AAA family ATPase [Candidatus Parvarchaeota archaeon]